ncbi:uncharacterized protein [Pagrus major]|uniref:uncharacterized protein n=1 Tax=Pagrus major TaxID=143350 RepID=UPI003CC8B487
MMSSSVHSVLWFSLLVLWASQSETEALTPDVCLSTFEGDAGIKLQSTEQEPDEEWAVLSDPKNFPCYLYLTNIVNCSWSFPTLQKDTELFISISVCPNEMEIESSEGRVGSKSFHLPEPEDLLILQFNISLHNNWAVYTYTYEISLHAILPPPANISASVKDGDLLVTWAAPPSDVHTDCFEYQLDLGDQEIPKNIKSKLSYTEQNADPSRTYRVRMRTRMLPDCEDNHEWSEWSQVVMIEPSNKLNILVIVSISLGIPMILLAVLLLVRYQRVSKVLFPPIPRPPPKYIHFLEKNDTFNIFLPAPSAEPMEEITEVED